MKDTCLVGYNKHENHGGELDMADIEAEVI